MESNFLVPGKQKLLIYEGEREQTLMAQGSAMPQRLGSAIASVQTAGVFPF